jgi:hypothetical protein
MPSATNAAVASAAQKARKNIAGIIALTDASGLIMFVPPTISASPSGLMILPRLPTAAVVAERTIRALIDIFTAEPSPGSQSGAAGRPSAYRPVLRRIALLIVIGSALAATRRTGAAMTRRNSSRDLK